MLYTLGVMGWLMLVTLPGGAIAFAVWLVVTACLFIVRWRARDPARYQTWLVRRRWQ